MDETLGIWNEMCRIKQSNRSHPNGNTYTLLFVNRKQEIIIGKKCEIHIDLSVSESWINNVEIGLSLVLVSRRVDMIISIFVCTY